MNSTASSLGSGPHARFPAERVIADATGGMTPHDGDILYRQDGRWVFIAASDLFYTKAEVDALLAAGS